MPAVFQVEGLKRLARDLKAVSPELAKTLTAANKKIATKALPAAKQAIASQPHKKAPEIAHGAKASAGQAFASIRVNHTLAASLEFGRKYHQLWGRTVPVSTLSRPIWLDHSGEGHAVRPLVKRMVESGLVDDEYANGLLNAFKAHGWT